MSNQKHWEEIKERRGGNYKKIMIERFKKMRIHKKGRQISTKGNYFYRKLLIINYDSEMMTIQASLRERLSSHPSFSSPVLFSGIAF